MIMKKIPIQRFQSETILKILGDSTRAAILRMLMAKPATLTQIGEVLEKHPAQIRHHIKQMEKLGVIELESVVKVLNYQEKYYAATAEAFFINLSFFPDPPPEGQFVILGSDDLALNLLTKTVNAQPELPHLLTIPIGSLDGLIYLRENYCQISGSHLINPYDGEYNVGMVRSLFSDRKMVLVTLTHRQQGLFVAKDNPKDVQTLKDLTRTDIEFINRNSGAGTRIWLEQTLRQENIDPNEIMGYKTEVNTHSQVIEAVRWGRADAGLAIYAASKFNGLEFIPLFEERYDLVMPEEVFQSEGFQAVLAIIRSEAYRGEVDALGGYNTSKTGEIIFI